MPRLDLGDSLSATSSSSEASSDGEGMARTLRKYENIAGASSVADAQVRDLTDTVAGESDDKAVHAALKIQGVVRGRNSRRRTAVSEQLEWRKLRGSQW